MSEERILELLREMRDEPLPADSLARVRMAVAAKTQRQQGWILRLTGVLALALTAVFAIALYIHRMPEPAPPAVLTSRAKNPLAGYVPPKPESVVSKDVPRRTKSQHDVLIRVETPDPDVVLFFVSGGSAE